MKTWATELLSRGDFVILDTETTGLGHTDEIVSIGLLSPTGEILLDCLVKPTISIPQEATTIHGITNKMVADAPGFMEIYPKLVELTADKLIVVYNADYDYRMIRQTLIAHNHFDVGVWDDDLRANEMTIKIGRDWECVMRRYAAYWGDWSDYHKSYRWQRLTAACAQQGVKIERAHRAIGDCQLTLALIKAVAVKANEELTNA